MLYFIYILANIPETKFFQNIYNNYECFNTAIMIKLKNEILENHYSLTKIILTYTVIES